MVTGGRASELSTCPFGACGCGLYLQSTWTALHSRMGRPRAEPVGPAPDAAAGADGHQPAATTWTKALSAAVERLRAVLASGKPIGVLGSGRATNEENFLAVGLARAALRTGHVDSCLRAPYHNLLAGLSPADAAPDGTPSLDDLEACDVVLLIEGDLALTHPQAAYAIMKAVKRGARLVTAGPVRTRLSRLEGRARAPGLTGDHQAGVERGVGIGPGDHDRVRPGTGPDGARPGRRAGGRDPAAPLAGPGSRYQSGGGAGPSGPRCGRDAGP